MSIVSDFVLTYRLYVNYCALYLIDIKGCKKNIHMHYNIFKYIILNKKKNSNHSINFKTLKHEKKSSKPFVFYYRY